MTVHDGGVRGEGVEEGPGDGFGGVEFPRQDDDEARALEDRQRVPARCDGGAVDGRDGVEPDDAARMVDAGASLVQLYTGFIYRGPALVRAAAKAASGSRP